MEASSIFSLKPDPIYHVSYFAAGDSLRSDTPASELLLVLFQK